MLRSRGFCSFITGVRGPYFLLRHAFLQLEVKKEKKIANEKRGSCLRPCLKADRVTLVLGLPYNRRVKDSRGLQAKFHR